MPATATLTPHNQPGPPLRVLIVDDDELDRFVIRRSFNAINAPLELIEVADPREAVQSIKDLQPDVTLLDIQMPDMNGFEVLQALAEDQQPVESTVVMLSSSAYPEDEKKALKLGARTYRTKPSTLDAYVKLAEDIHQTFGPGKAA